jgi:hypothetical protein
MKNPPAAWPFLKAATAYVPSLGVVVRRVMTDNNCRYKASISTALAEFSLRRVPDRPLRLKQTTPRRNPGPWRQSAHSAAPPT